jgi:hypothetical protein
VISTGIPASGKQIVDKSLRYTITVGVKCFGVADFPDSLDMISHIGVYSGVTSA